MDSVRPEPDFDFDSAEYRELFAGSAATAFQHPVWLDRLYRHLVPHAAAEPLVVTVRDRDGRLAMVLPMLRRRRGGLRYVEFADLGVSDYAAPVCRPAAFERLCRDEAAKHAIRKALGRFDVLRVPKLRQDSPDLSRLFPGSSRRAMEGSAHSVRLGGDFDDWRATTLTRSYRRELDKKRRRLVRAGTWRLERPTGSAEIAAAFAVARELRIPRFEHRDTADVLSDPTALAFYVDVAASGSDAGFARTYILRHDDRVTAMLFGLRHAGRLCVVVSAFDATLGNLSLGSLMFEDVIADCIREGDEVFDLTIGDEAYKKNFGTVATMLSTVTRHGSLVGRAACLVLNPDWSRRIVKGLAAPRRPAIAKP